MSETTTQAYQCDECGHIWLKTAKLPSHCAKCHTRRWNTKAETAPLDVKIMPESIERVTVEHKLQVESVPNSHKVHNARTCKLYRCGLCAIGKGKD